MTALTVPARPEQDDASLRPVPWRRMAWVTWRQHRIALAGVAVLLGALAVYLWIAGLPLHHAYTAAVACHPASSAACQGLVDTFNGMGNHMTGATSPGGVFLQVVPVLIGAFVGAPVLAREMETGTFRYAWTQGFGRWRWALAKLALLAVVLAAAAGAVGVLVSWYYQPYFAAGNQALGLYEMSPFATLFTLRGVAFPAWTLAAFAIGALAGMLIRRVVPAIVATLAVYAGLAVAIGGFLREHYLTPLVTTNPNVPGTAWIISQWWTKDGRFAFAGNPPGNLLNQFCSSVPPGPGRKPSVGSFAQCLVQHGYTQLTSYQPASRFWPFQWIEGGWLLVLSALLIAATIWLVRRRAA
jgi:ABC-2 family transporter protein